MSTTPSTDARAVVKALAALTTQVKRIADSRQSDFVLSDDAPDDDATTGDDALLRTLTNALTAEHYRRAREQIVASPEEHSAAMAGVALDIVSVFRTAGATTPATTCNARYTGVLPVGDCIRAAGHAPATDHIDDRGRNFGDSSAEYPTGSTVRVISHILPMTAQRAEEMQERTRLISEWVDGQQRQARAAGVDPTPEWRRRGTRDLSIREQAPAAGDATCRRMETRTCPSSYGRPCGDRPCARFESDDPTPWLDNGAVKIAGTVPRPAEEIEDERPVREHVQAEEEQTLRWTRRESLLVLLTRLQRGRTLSEAEADTLRQHVETEIREADTARTEAQRLGLMVNEYGQGARQLGERLQASREETASADRIRAEVQRDRDQHAAVLIDALCRFTHATNEHGTFTGHQCLNIPDETFRRWHSVIAPTAERPWWETVAEVRAELEEARAAIERVRAHATDAKTRYGHGRNDYEIGKHDLASTVLGALDGTEQQAEASIGGELAEYQAAVARVAKVLAEAERHRNQTHPSERQDCVMCGADHFAEALRAIDGTEQPTTEA